MSGFTPGPWHWVIHDHSLATLGVGDNPGMGDPFVLSLGPCEACAGRADPKEWKWDRCQTPSEADARLIAAAPELLSALDRLQHNFTLLLAGKPVRDVAETEAEVNAAIAKASEATTHDD